jgi:hypothetical protein
MKLPISTAAITRAHAAGVAEGLRRAEEIATSLIASRRSIRPGYTYAPADQAIADAIARERRTKGKP